MSTVKKNPFELEKFDTMILSTGSFTVRTAQQQAGTRGRKYVVQGTRLGSQVPYYMIFNTFAEIKVIPAGSWN